MHYKPFSDEYFMNEALKLAKNAFDKDEVPVGAVIVVNNKIIAKSYNLTETLNDTTAHAEILAITTATEFLQSKYINNATIYVTLEPCIMCLGAINWSKISKIVYGASDLKKGYFKYEEILNNNQSSLLHNKIIVKKGVLESECSLILRKFFKKKRKY